MSNQPIWFFLADDFVCGPKTAAELAQLAKSGTILPTTPIRKGEDGEWLPAKTVRGLFDATSQNRIPSPAPITLQDTKNVTVQSTPRRTLPPSRRRNRWIVPLLSIGTPIVVFSVVLGLLISVWNSGNKPKSMLAGESKSVSTEDRSSQPYNGGSTPPFAPSHERSGNSQTLEPAQPEVVPRPLVNGRRVINPNQGNTPSMPAQLAPSGRLNDIVSSFRAPPITLNELIQVLGRPDQQRGNEILYSGILRIGTGFGVTSIEFNTDLPKAQFFIAGLLSSELFTPDESVEIIEMLDRIGETKDIGRFRVRISETDLGYGIPWRRIDIASRQ